jgi:hypothetical protein
LGNNKVILQYVQKHSSPLLDRRAVRSGRHHHLRQLRLPRSFRPYRARLAPVRADRRTGSQAVRYGKRRRGGAGRQRGNSRQGQRRWPLRPCPHADGGTLPASGRRCRDFRR